MSVVRFGRPQGGAKDEESAALHRQKRIGPVPSESQTPAIRGALRVINIFEGFHFIARERGDKFEGCDGP